MTQRVSVAIACSCGYRGPSVAIAGQAVCPICHKPAASPPPGPSVRPPAAPAAPVVFPHQPAAATGHQPVPPTTHRIACPRGHVLTAGEHMLGQQVVCPECNELFLLRREDSLEHRKKQEKARRDEEERMARLWLSRAILAAAFIVASLVGMIAFSFTFRPSPPPPAGPPSAPAPAARTD